MLNEAIQIGCLLFGTSALANLVHWLTVGRPGTFLLSSARISPRVAQGVSLVSLAMPLLYWLKMFPDTWFAVVGFTLATVVNLADIYSRHQRAQPLPPS